MNLKISLRDQYVVHILRARFYPEMVSLSKTN